MKFYLILMRTIFFKNYQLSIDLRLHFDVELMVILGDKFTFSIINKSKGINV